MRNAVLACTLLLLALSWNGNIQLGGLAPLVWIALILAMAPTLLDVLGNLELDVPASSMGARLNRVGPGQNAALEFIATTGERTWYGPRNYFLDGLVRKEFLTRRLSLKPWRGLWRYQVNEAEWRYLMIRRHEFRYPDIARAPFDGWCLRNGHWVKDPRGMTRRMDPLPASPEFE